MRNLSAEFKEQQNIGNHRYLKFVDITLRNGTELHLDNSNLWSNGFSFDEAVSSDNNFDIGSAIINKFSVVINNIEEQFSDYVFAGATAVVYAGLELSTGVEKIRICTGVVSEEPKQKSSIITLSFLDNMSKFDKDYSGVKTVFPATRNQIVRDICSHCGVTLQTVNFDNDSYIIQSRPDDEALTCRQMLAWVAQIGCQWAKCDAYGRLCIDWYKDILVGEISVNSNGILTINEKDVSGNKTPISLLISSDLALYPSSGDFEIKDGKLNYKAGIASDRPINISKMTNMSVDLEDVVITGVKVTEYKEGSSEDNPAKTYMYGKEGYVLSISDNKLITENTGNTITSIIGEKCVGMRFRPFSANCITDIAIEAGDPVAVIDRKGNTFLSYATNVKLQPGSFELISCGAESSERNSAKQYSLLTQAEVAARKNIQKEKTEREKALEELAIRLENSPGVFTTVETDTGGGKIYYLHNKPKLSDSDMVWKMTAEAWAVSTDGGKTWNAGMTVDGDTVVRILTATGVNADWINTGTITVKDSNGNIIFLVDMDTKSVIISGDTVKIGGRPIQDVINSGIEESKSYSDKQLADYANIVTKDLENLQSQVDGQVEDYYYDYEPSMQNIPASQWTTTEERQKHIGDRFFWKSKGYAYRFMENNGVWGWTLLQDTDITKAMQTAQNAKDIADGKRRNFVTTPQPPYDIGDLWTNGEDILTCIVSRASGGGYVSSDWEKLNNYTDDTVANQALEEARKAHNLTISLDNEYQGIPADYNGNISQFPSVKTHVTVFYGHDDVSASCTYSVQKSSSITGSWDNARREYIVTGLSADTGWVDITANYMNLFTVTKRFNVAKNKGGTPGISGTSVTITSKSITYQASSNGTTPPTGEWNPSVPSIEKGQYLWTRTIVNYSDGSSTTSYSVGYQGSNGANGLNAATIYLYQRKTSVPEKPSAAITYTFATGAVSGLTNGWSKTIPSGTDPLYVILATAASMDASDTIAATEWSIPVIMAENGKTGTDGIPGRTYFIEASSNVLKRSKDNTISPNFIEFKAYYRDGNSAARTPYAGRFIIEETVDGNTWKTIYTSTANEDTVKHYLYSLLSTQTGQIVAAENGSIIGVPRDVTSVRCKLYASGGTTNLMDMQSVAVVVDVDALTVDEILDIITDNGKWQGFYKGPDGRVYVSFEAALGGLLKLGGVNNGNGRQEIYDASGKLVGRFDNTGLTFYYSYNSTTSGIEYKGILIGKNGIEYIEGKFSDDIDIIITQDPIISFNSDTTGIDGDFDNLTANESTFYRPCKMLNLSHVSSGGHLVFESDGVTLAYLASSSKRYKDIKNDINGEDMERWYNITPVWAKYKDGYLSPNDRRNGECMPMFIAEDIENYMPIAVNYQDGNVEDWNERIIIPAMFAMIKSQKTQIDELKRELEIIRKRSK